MARSGAECGGAVDRRLLGQLCVGRRADPHQPPLRRRLRREHSTANNNILKNGFITRTRGEEKKCAGQQAEVVTSIRDVTPQVKTAIGSATGEPAVKAR